MIKQQILDIWQFLFREQKPREEAAPENQYESDFENDKQDVVSFKFKFIDY